MFNMIIPHADSLKQTSTTVRYEELFISDSRRGLFERIGMGDDHIEHKMLSRGIENAQKRIENRNFDLRKNLLEYDDVANDQRQACL